MFRILAGSFVRPISSEDDSATQTVTISRDFLISDREVSVDQFRQFVDDPSYEPSEKPVDWPGEDKRFSPTGEHPVQRISWYDAILFCNWLSHREGLPPCYQRTGREDELELRGQEEWRLVPEVNGYRLTTEAEWELACRAGNKTIFLCGDDEDLLHQYAVFSTAAPAPCGSKLPNHWELFDMAGNIFEWCHDWYGTYGSESNVTDPINVKQLGMRVMRGGMYSNPAHPCASSERSRSGPWGRSEFAGLRVARSIEQ